MQIQISMILKLNYIDDNILYIHKIYDRVRRMIEICLIMESQESKIFEFSRNVSTKKRFEVLREFKLKKISWYVKVSVFYF